MNPRADGRAGFFIFKRQKLLAVAAKQLSPSTSAEQTLSGELSRGNRRPFLVRLVRFQPACLGMLLVIFS